AVWPSNFSNGFKARASAFGSFTTLPRVRFLRGLAEAAPGDLRRAHLYSGGSEAVEAALRLAKAHTKKFEFIGFWGGFHGKTGGVLGLIGDDFKHQRGPLAPGSYSVPYANCYRCPFQATHPECSFLCVEFLRKFIRHNTSGCIAAILVEPIQGTAGNVVPPPGFLKALRDVAREAEALLITDEIITGFGRTGKMFCVEHEGIVPDIMTLGKGMGGGFPVSGLISTDEIVAAKPFSIPSASSSSYGGNPLAAAACLVTLETILEEKLVENSHAVGALMLDQLREIEARYPFVGDVRGKGLMIGVELVRDKKTKEPLSGRATKALFQLALEQEIILMITNSVIRINPALILSREEANQVPDLVRTKVSLIPESVTEIRVVDIDGLDVQADGGTHVASTKDVGRIRIVGYESKGRINKRLRLQIEDE
ncbi:MAG: aminotransferase class III-fold pyridoxal phosphate-dependent enzyme, partial [Thermodesulfobacteriota bacterium]